MQEIKAFYQSKVLWAILAAIGAAVREESKFANAMSLTPWRCWRQAEGCRRRRWT